MKKTIILLAIILLSCKEDEVMPSIPKEPEAKTTIEKANRVVRAFEEGTLITEDECIEAAYMYKHFYQMLMLSYELGKPTDRIRAAMRPYELKVGICYYEFK